MKTLLDSTGWVEFFTAGPLANRYAAYLSEKDLITPTIVLYEVYKKIKRERGEPEALIAAGRLSSTLLVPLSQSIALHAADMALRHGLAMADAIVYATAHDQDARLVTGDADLKDLPGVVYIR